MRYYKWMADGKPIYGRGKYAQPGEWQPRIEGKLEICRRGYHVCTADQIPYWCGTELIEVEVGGVVEVGSDKVLCRTWREIRRYKWTREDMIQFAKDCAAAAYAAARARAAAACARDASAAAARATTYAAAAAARATTYAATAADAERRRQKVWIEDRIREKLT